MDKKIIKYLAGEIGKDQLNSEEAEIARSIEMVDQLLEKSAIEFASAGLSDKLLYRFDLEKRRKASWLLVKWWLGISSALGALLSVAVILYSFPQTPQVISKAVGFIHTLLHYGSSELAAWAMLFVTSITLLFIIDRILVTKWSAQR